MPPDRAFAPALHGPRHRIARALPLRRARSGGGSGTGSPSRSRSGALTALARRARAPSTPPSPDSLYAPRGAPSGWRGPGVSTFPRPPGAADVRRAAQEICAYALDASRRLIADGGAGLFGPPLPPARANRSTRPGRSVIPLIPPMIPRAPALWQPPRRPRCPHFVRTSRAADATRPGAVKRGVDRARVRTIKTRGNGGGEPRPRGPPEGGPTAPRGAHANAGRFAGKRAMAGTQYPRAVRPHFPRPRGAADGPGSRRARGFVGRGGRGEPAGARRG